MIPDHQKSGNEAATPLIERIVSADTAPFMQAKLHRPVTPRDLVSRAKLLDLLEVEQTRPLTLVSAPAGYGKSTLIASWLANTARPSAWISLDPDDSNLRRFLDYFTAAVEGIFPRACQTTRNLVSAAKLAPVSTLASSLANELDAIDQPFVLVLDDYHGIDVQSPVNELLEVLLLHPPLPLNLVIITRRDPALPLITLRAGGHMTEIRMQDLRFNAAETRALLEKSMGFSASDSAIANLEHELEGWAAGLRLVSLASRHIEDPEKFLNDLHGGVQQTQEYLVQEVINSQPAWLHDWLLKTSIFDRFSGPLCEAVCAPPEADQATGYDCSVFIQTLRDGNLFAESLDTWGGWFRYHHLFRELLRRQLVSRLAPEEIARLHIRASQWFEKEKLIDEALKHALAAGDMRRAARIIERNKQSVLETDQWRVLEHWLSLMPESFVQQRMELLMGRAWVFYFRSLYKGILPILDQVESLLGDEPASPVLRGQIAFFRGTACFFQGDGVRSLNLLKEAMELIPVSWHLRRSEIEVLFELATQMVLGPAQAARVLDRLLNSYPAPHKLRKIRLLGAGVIMHMVSGDLAGAGTFNRQLHDISVESGNVYPEAWSDYLQGLIHLNRFELSKAVSCLKQADEQRFIYDTRAAVDALAALMLAYQFLGQPDEARATLQQLREFAAAQNDPEYSALAATCETRLALLQGRPGSATGWTKTGVPGPAGAMLFWTEIPCVTRCRALIAQGSTTGLTEAEEYLRQYVQLNENHHNVCHLIETLGLLAVACWMRGKQQEALAVLERALACAAEGEVIFPFMEAGQPMPEMLRHFASQKGCTEFMRRVSEALQTVRTPPMNILAGTPRKDAAAATWNRESLTHRELEILELAAKRLQNKEIANQLFVSPETVKTHIKHLYQKLGVSNRREIAAVAGEILADLDQS